MLGSDFEWLVVRLAGFLGSDRGRGKQAGDFGIDYLAFVIFDNGN